VVDDWDGHWDDGHSCVLCGHQCVAETPGRGEMAWDGLVWLGWAKKDGSPPISVPYLLDGMPNWQPSEKRIPAVPRNVNGPFSFPRPLHPIPYSLVSCLLRTRYSKLANVNVNVVNSKRSTPVQSCHRSSFNNRCLECHYGRLRYSDHVATDPHRRPPSRGQREWGQRWPATWHRFQRHARFVSARVERRQFA
jgi:hypothetical protein